MALRSFLCCLLLCWAAPAMAAADPPPFDLAGPSLSVRVTHGGVTLPVSQAPNLSPGDQLWIKADLPATQSVQYLLVAAFLRGATNPPPSKWFYSAQTWNHTGRNGLNITVPADAQQVIVFLAPHTNGDLKTLIGAVRGRPGAFVRASQDLNQATLDRSRLDAFLSVVRKGNPADPDWLKTVSPLLARSLTIKLNDDCFQKTPDLQAACLMHGPDGLVLNDGHSTSIVETLTSGSPADLALELSAAPQAGYGYYSPYIAAVSDIARIMDSFQTAQYQYIPAIATLHDDKLSLLLNTPPSFHNPLSVIVAALPAVEQSQAPPLQPVDPKEAYCAARSDLVLHLDGAPLVYSTQYAHDIIFRIRNKGGQTIDLPAHADAEKGGLVIDAKGYDATKFGEVIDGSLTGYWGFTQFDGPEYRLQNPHPEPWRLADGDQQALVVGRDDTVHLQGRDAACIESIALQPPSGEAKPLVWKIEAPDRLNVTVPLAEAQPGSISLLIGQYGIKEPSSIPVQTFAQAGHLDNFTFHAGDLSGVLKGRRLDEVVSLSLGGIAFQPNALTSNADGDELSLITTDEAGAETLKAGKTLPVRIALKDGRTLNLKSEIAAFRPSVALIGKSVQPAAPDPASQGGAIAIKLTDPAALAQADRLTFSVRAQRPPRFSTRETIEVAAANGAASTSLSTENGLTFEDAQVAVATLDPAKALGASAFGPLQFRIVVGGVAGEWQPLATLVRLPILRELKCREGAAQPCELTGSKLFLIGAVSSEPSFHAAIAVPEGFPGAAIPTPSPIGRLLYLKLRDDPQAIDRISLPPRKRSPPSATAAQP